MVGICKKEKKTHPAQSSRNNNHKMLLSLKSTMQTLCVRGWSWSDEQIQLFNYSSLWQVGSA